MLRIGKQTVKLEEGWGGGVVRGILPHPRWVLSLVVVVVVES